MIGRKLNTRLAELKMQSKETMSKQQLQKLFEHERDKELERLGEISEAAKIFGRAGDVVDMELDLEAGWADQLLAKFGTRVELSLEERCIGLSYLLKNGVPLSHVDAIRINYRAERTTAVSTSFEAGISRLMYHFEIEDTAINRGRTRLAKTGWGPASDVRKGADRRLSASHARTAEADNRHQY